MGLTLTKRKRSPFWYVRGTVKGLKILESTGIPHANRARPTKIAEDYRDKRAREIESAAVYGRSHSATFLDAAVSYLEGGGSPRFLGEFDEETQAWSGLIGKVGGKELKALDQSYLNAVASELYPNCTAATINRQFWTPFIAVWNHASKGNNPLCQAVAWQRPHIAKKRKPRKDVDYQDAIALINACDWHAAKILFFLFWTGCRPEEAFTLLTESVNPEQRWAAIEKAKTDVPRGIPLHDALIPLLTFETKRTGHVFLSSLGEPYKSRKKVNKSGRVLVQGGGQIKTAVGTARRNTGLNIVPYNARHTVSTYLIWPGGVSPYVKDEILGHADAADMSKHYVHLPRQPLIDAINVLPDPRKMGLREDLWKPKKIQEMAEVAYTRSREENSKKRCTSRELPRRSRRKIKSEQRDSV